MKFDPKKHHNNDDGKKDMQQEKEKKQKKHSHPINQLPKTVIQKTKGRNINPQPRQHGTKTKAKLYSIEMATNRDLITPAFQAPESSTGKKASPKNNNPRYRRIWVFS